MTKKATTTVRLTDAGRLLLEALSKQHGLTHTAILETAIREKAKREKIQVAQHERPHAATP